MRRFVFAIVVLTALIGAAMSTGYADSSSRLAGNHPIEAEHRVALGNLDASQPLKMEIHLKLRNERQLDQFLEDVQNPDSPQYRRFLKPGEFDQKFGPLKSDIDAIAGWLRFAGFSVTSTSGSVQFTGTVSQAERTFAVHILKLSAAEYANMEDPALPARFASLIGHLEGLDNLTHFAPVLQTSYAAARKHHVVPPSSHKLTRAESLAIVTRATSALAYAQPAVNINGVAYGDVDMRNTYDVLSDFTIGGGDCIAIVGMSDYLDAALTIFTNQFSALPAFQVTRVNVGTNPGRIGGGNEAEAELDLEWSHVMAPGAPAHFYLGSNLQSDIAQAINDDICKVVSISFEFCGGSSSLFTSTLDNLFKKASGQGQSVFISTGDHGAAGTVFDMVSRQCVAGSSQMVSEMAADPNVTAVGGTEILSPAYDQNDIAQGYATEKVWNDPENGFADGGAGGGGASALFLSKPSYQTGPGVPNDGKRDIPDVAMLSGSPRVFYGDENNGTAFLNCCEGGTSLAAPLWAGIAKDIEAQIGPLGSINPTLYVLANQQFEASATPNGFHDVTSGDNTFNGVTGFTAGTGYDQATGWGSVDFEEFQTAFEKTAPTKTATPTATATVTATFTPTPVATTSVLGSPSQVKFSNVDASSSSKPQRVLFINRGTVAAALGQVSYPSGFSPTSDGCSNQMVPVKRNCAVMVAFSPTTPGPLAGPLSVSYNGASPATVELSGNGTVVSVRGPLRVIFPKQTAGTSGPSRPVVVTNNSRTATVKMGVTPAPSGSFTAASDTCSGQFVGPRGRCTIGLEFSPPIGSASKSTLTGTLSLTFTYGGNLGNVPNIALSGTVK
jgi:subtilase family serine protease